MNEGVLIHQLQMHWVSFLFLSVSGVFYRPASLKSMTCLLGNTEKRTVYDNFELHNLNLNAHDYSHELYEKYLENHRYIPPKYGALRSTAGGVYWAHTTSNQLPTVPSDIVSKGLFNVFPLSLTSDQLNKAATASTLGKTHVFSTPPPHLLLVPTPFKKSIVKMVHSQYTMTLWTRFFFPHAHLYPFLPSPPPLPCWTNFETHSLFFSV
jgi:hypothetical protein